MGIALWVVRTTFLFGMGIALGLAWYAWHNRPKPGTRPLTALMLSTALWLGAFTLASVSGFELSLVWLNLTFLGVSGVVVSLFAFALEFTGRGGLLTRRTVGLLLLEPLYVQLMAWTNRSHYLFWTRLDPVATDITNVIGVARQPWGPAYYAHTVVSYVLVAAAVFLLVRLAVQSDELYSQQAGAIIFGTFAPWILNFLFIVGLSPVDLTPVGFVVTGLAAIYAMFRYQLMDVTPVARNTVVDTLNAGVFVLDRDNRFLDVNQFGADLLGMDPDELIGRPIAEALADLPTIRDRFEAATEVSETTEYELEYGNFHFRVEATPLESGDEDVGQVVLVHDITEQKHRQRELERQNEQLDQFAAVVSHDLRNPLTVADSRVELLASQGEDVDDLQSHLAKISDAHQRMEQLIDDVLTLAREGKTIDETETVDLGITATEAWEHVSTGEATLVVDSSGPIRADPSRLRRVFENLFRNAIEHASEDGPPTVTVGMLDARETDDRLTPPGFYVADDGPGIPEVDREQIFDAGESGQGSSGLGLAIVESIVEAHGWTIEVTESDDGGARFEIRHVETAEDDESGPWVTAAPDDIESEPTVGEDRTE